MISAILHIDREVEEPWPLAILDNDGDIHYVDIPPGTSKKNTREQLTPC